MLRQVIVCYTAASIGVRCCFVLSVPLHARYRHHGNDADCRSAHAATTRDSIGLKPLTPDLTTDLGRSGYLLTLVK